VAEKIPVEAATLERKEPARCDPVTVVGRLSYPENEIGEVLSITRLPACDSPHSAESSRPNMMCFMITSYYLAFQNARQDSCIALFPSP
jgi:hypothetical protein